MRVNSITIKIDDFENDEMQENRTEEVRRILQDLTDQLVEGGGIVSAFDGLRLRDTNGNTVGSVEVDWEA